MVESIDAPAVAERLAAARTGHTEIDATNAVPTADGGPRVIIQTVGLDDDGTGDDTPDGDPPVPPVPGNGHDTVSDGGADPLEVPAFLRR